MTKEFNRSFHFDVNGHSFRIQNFYDDNRSGFNHTSVAYMDNLNIGEARCHYINRTWERYGYQSSAISAICAAIVKQKETTKRIYKLNHHIERMTKTHSENLEALYGMDTYLTALNQACDYLRENQPKTVYAWEV